MTQLIEGVRPDWLVTLPLPVPTPPFGADAERIFEEPGTDDISGVMLHSELEEWQRAG